MNCRYSSTKDEMADYWEDFGAKASVELPPTGETRGMVPCVSTDASRREGKQWP